MATARGRPVVDEPGRRSGPPRLRRESAVAAQDTVRLLARRRGAAGVARLARRSGALRRALLRRLPRSGTRLRAPDEPPVARRLRSRRVRGPYASHDEAGSAIWRAFANPVFLDDALGGSATWFEAFVDYWSGPGSWRALSAAAQASFLRVGRKVYLEARSLLADRTPPTAYACITAPTLLLGGERSPVAAQRVIALLDGALPRARLNVLAGAGHMGPISHAPEVNALIAEHIAAADART